MYSRRDFIATGLTTLGAASLVDPRYLVPARAAKKLLILGGTGFVGPHNVREALKRGHEVTIFNRGKSGKGMFGKDVEELAGDRASDLSALKGRKWDAVIDESASLASAPEWVKLSGELLRDNVEQYLFISTRSVYFDLSSVPMTNAAPVLTLENSPIEAGKPLSYGHAKAYAEKALHEIMPGRVTVVRPGLIVGPEDDTDRFTYWPVRIARGDEVLVPGDGSDHVQIIDVRDLMKFCVTLTENRTFGVFNGVGPQGGQPFREFVSRIQQGVGSNPTYTWVDADFLRANGANPYGRELPVYQVMRGRTAGFARFDITPELKAGLTVRPMEDTARDTLAWWKTLPADRQAAIKTGFTPEREQALLALWKARAGK
ncbi:NAD-dependent epimerase/dehydratase family protein [Gemmatimonas sp.]|uniref:NAD-dependent epimerase/dehydratase family protein n=1 Tax=Gemmatimonas sp. TaxID=1962908 RepID=UPI003DA58C2C